MPPNKAKVLEQLSEVKNLGPAFADKAYEELGVRSLDDLVKAAEAGKLQTLKGIGAAKEKSILSSARELAKGGAKPAPAPEAKSDGGTTKKKASTKSTTAKEKPAKAKAAKEKPAKEKPAKKAADTSKRANAESIKAVREEKAAKSAAPKPSATKEAQTSAADSKTAKQEPKPKAPNPEAGRAEAKPSATKEEAKSGSNGAASTERPRTTYRPPAVSKSRPSIPGLIFKLGKKIIGRILS